MKRSVYWIAAVLLLGGAGSYFGWRTWRTPHEPLIGGKNRQTWLEELRSDDAMVGAQSARTLADLGESGLAVLLEARKDADLRVHRRAAAGLVRLGPAAAPALIGVLDRGGGRVETILVRMGAGTVPALEKALASGDQARPAARVLGGMGERAQPAVAALVGLLQNLSASEEARAEAASALGLIGPEKTSGLPAAEGDPSVGALTAALSGPPQVRLAAARSLRQIGPAARTAVPSLARLARDQDVQTAAVACEALGQVGGAAAAAPLAARLLAADEASQTAALALARLGPAARTAIGPLISALKSDKEDGRLARAVLERLGAAAVPDLEDALKESDPAIRRGAADVLGLMGPRASASAPALVRLLADRNAAVATRAALALVNIDPAKAPLAAPVLIRLFKEKDEKVSTGAALVLAHLGPDARLAVAELLKALNGKDEKLARRAAYVLGRICVTTQEVVSGLRSALSRPTGAGAAAAEALGRLGEPAKAAIPDLLKALKQPALRPYAALALVQIDLARAVEAGQTLAEDLSREGPARSAALAALQRMPRAPAEVVASLRPLLADRQWSRPAQRVVRRLGPRVRVELIPDLVTLLSDPDAELRQEAGLTLRLIGAPALPALKRALSAPGPATRAAAAWTLDGSFREAIAGDADFLLPLLEDADETVRQSAAAACGSLGVRSPAGVAAMVELLASTEVDLRRSAVRALRTIWAEQSDLLEPHLLECLLDPDSEVRQAAAETLRTAGPAMTAQTAAAVKEALHDQSLGVRLAAAETLAQCKKASAAELTSVLLALAHGAEPAGRRMVLEVLFALSPERTRELKAEVEADLRAESVEDRTEAGEWLIRLDEGAAGKVLPFLIGILNGWNETARLQAVLTLERLGPAAKEALPALKRRAEFDEDERVRALARRAVGKIEKPSRPRSADSS